MNNERGQNGRIHIFGHKKNKGFKQRFRLVLKSKLNGENRITAIHAWVVTVYRYGARILQWKESELKDVDRKSSKQ